MAGQKISAEPIIEPDLPIIDPHHHLWVLTEAELKASDVMYGPINRVRRKKAHYLLEDLLADINTGHNVVATVYAECDTMYRTYGPQAMRSVGEVEFANGMAAMAASGTFGPIKVCAGIVGNPNLLLGDAVAGVLEAHIQAGGGRYRGMRTYVAPDTAQAKYATDSGKPTATFDDPHFRAGFKWLKKLGLSFDLLILEHALPQVADFARDFPETPIILNHCGIPIAHVSEQGINAERFGQWREHIRALSKCENVFMKIGGLGMPEPGFRSFMSTPPATSEQLAAEWRPYIETSIEAFGAARCMFESNFPVDSGTCTYPVLWNTFKRVVSGASHSEKTALFSGTAKRIYRLDV